MIPSVAVCAGVQFAVDLFRAALVDPYPIDRFGLHLRGALLERFKGGGRDAIPCAVGLMGNAHRIDRSGAAGHHHGLAGKRNKGNRPGAELTQLVGEAGAEGRRAQAEP